MCVLCSCGEELIADTMRPAQDPIELSGKIEQENITRADDYGFVAGDRMGVYIVDYEGEVPGALSATDNRASNMLYTYGGDESRAWKSPTQIYWRDKQTPIDVYGYYPGYNYINQPTAWQFEVQASQDMEAKDGNLSGYEQSDLLWGKTTKVMPTKDQIVIRYDHILAGVRVHLNKGEGMTDVEWQKLEKIVQVENTVRHSTVDLSTGAVSVKAGQAVSPVRMLPQSGDDYRAVVIPQQVSAGSQLLSITLDGQTYSHSLSKVMDYQSGKLHQFTMTVNKREESGDYEIAISYDGITPWVNDETSHSFSAMMYVTVNCPEMNTLKESITKAGYDYKTIQNLKITGEISHEDFNLLNKEMPELKHLNLKNVNVRHICYYDAWWDTGSHDGNLYMDGMIPDNAFYGNKTIRSLVLPSQITHIGCNAFREMNLMYSTLEVPDGVRTLYNEAFAYNDYNGVELILPMSLDSISRGSFIGCHYRCELKLTDNITFIGHDAFDGADNFYGTFHIPSKLQSVDNAFSGLGKEGSFDGELEIPQGLKSIENAFGVAMNKRVALNLPQGVKKIGRGWPQKGFSSIHFNDDLEEIGDACFRWYSCPFAIKLPSSLVKVGNAAFDNAGFEGELVIPENCLNIGAEAFSLNQFTKVTLPSKLEIIPERMLASLSLLTSIVIPKYVNKIGERAFADCSAMQTVICLSPEPPTLGENVFAGLYMDKVVLEVPEASVEVYRHADGWKEFQNITAYHELAFNIPEIVCMDKGATRQGMIRAESDWEVSECPSWVTVTPASGTYKDELTVVVDNNTGATREGRIVFRLKDKDYTTYTTVRQIASDDYQEDATVTLQAASAGAKAIPLFIVGEGYGAEDIASGQYLTDMKEQMEHLFSTEPYKTYRNYFTVSTAFACSPMSGMDGMTKFGQRNEKVWEYAQQYGTDMNEHAAVLVLCNTQAYGNHTDLWDDGLSFSWLGKNQDIYPYDQRGDVLHYLGGRGFGKLGPEYVNHFTFMKDCWCPQCNMTEQYNWARSKGWWQNVAVSSKLSELPWAHLIFDERYAQQVDVYEGALNHARSTYRSENQSVMGAAHVYYYNTISREEIVRRILTCAGETYSFEKFVENDKMELP